MLQMFKKSLVTVAISSIIFMFLGLSACSTVQGLGDDVSSGGKALSKAAQKAKN